MAAIINNDSKCAQIWQEMPYICNMNPHVLQYSFEKKYSWQHWETAIESCFIHKLTYKYNKDTLDQTEESMLQHLMKVY